MRLDVLLYAAFDFGFKQKLLNPCTAFRRGHRKGGALFCDMLSWFCCLVARFRCCS